MRGQADPFLKLVEDRKLQAIHIASSITYGSNEDDASASRCLSQMQLSEDQTKESFVSEIMNNLCIAAVRK